MNICGGHGRASRGAKALQCGPVCVCVVENPGIQNKDDSDFLDRYFH